MTIYIYIYIYICVCVHDLCASFLVYLKMNFIASEQYVDFLLFQEWSIFIFLIRKNEKTNACRPRKFFGVKTSVRSFYGYTRSRQNELFILQSAIKYWEAPPRYLDEYVSKITIRFKNIVRFAGKIKYEHARSLT
jgi:hypothetical protein